MPLHLAEPWILARIVAALCTLALTLASVTAAVRVLRHVEGDSPWGEAALRAERLGDAMASVFSAALVSQFLGAVLHVVTAHRLAASVRGAMCAFGVLHAVPGGEMSVPWSLVTGAAGAAWLGRRAVDQRMERGFVTRSLARWVLPLGACLVVDTVLALRVFLTLDLDVQASCCSTFVDTAGAVALPSTLRSPLAGGVLFAMLAVVVAAVSLRASAGRAPGVETATAMGGLVTCVLGWRAAADVVAPFVYESPSHPCAYCLLRTDALPSGPVLLGALAVATGASAALLSISPWLRSPVVGDASREVVRPLRRLLGGGLVLALVAAVWPVVRYGLATGSLHLFG